MRKRITIGMGLLLLLSLLLSACGRGGDSSSASPGQSAEPSAPAQPSGPSAEPEPEPISLKLWNNSTPGGDKGAQALIDAYQKAHPNVKIEFTTYAGETYESIIKTALAGNSGPDLYFTHGYNNLQLYVDAGYAEPVDAVDTALYDEASLLPITIKGNIYAGPGMGTYILTIFYNKDIFAQHGLSIPKTPEEFTDVVEKLKAAEITPIAMGGAESISYLFSLFAIAPALLGDNWYKDAKEGTAGFTDPRFAALNQTLVDWGKNGYFQKNYEGAKFESAKILFQSGKAAMLINGTWDYQGIKTAAPDLKFGAFNMPGKDGVRGTRSVNAGFTVNSASPHKDAAMDFIRFTFTEEAAKLYAAASGDLPVLSSVEVKDEGIREAMTADGWQEFLYTPFNLVGINNQNPQEVWQAEFMKLALGQTTMDEMLRKVDSTYDKKAYTERF